MEMVAQWKSARTAFGRLGVQVFLISTHMGAVAQWKSRGLINSGGGSNPPSPHPFAGNRQLLGIPPLGVQFSLISTFYGDCSLMEEHAFSKTKAGGSTPPSLHTFTGKR